MDFLQKNGFCLFLVVATGTLAQPPAPQVPAVNFRCDDGPKMVGPAPDTLPGAPDAEGFYSLFNGKDLQGWWESCKSGHSNQDRTNGAFWYADSMQGFLYSSQNQNGAGSLLSTNKKYDHYELIFDFWPVWGNDAGIFNRCTETGKAWQTGLDYIKGSGIGGSYSENGWSPTTINDDPFMFGDTYANPDITTWTDFTSGKNPTSFGCSPGGCTSSDFTKVWNPSGWNQIRIKFYGGIQNGSQVTMESWMRKAESPEVGWVPIYKSSKNVVTPPGFITIQIHGGTDRWKAGTQNVYRNIKVRALNEDGSPIIPVGIRGKQGSAPSEGLRRTGDRLVGHLTEDARISVWSPAGKLLHRFAAQAGNLDRAIPFSAGLVLVRVETGSGAVSHTLSPGM